MIDPNIALQVQPVKPVNPIESYGQLLSLKNMLQQQQIGKQNLTALGLENQQRQNALADTAAVNDALKSNTSLDANGMPTIDHGGVIKSLSAAGHGKEAIAYQSQLAKTQKEQADAMKVQLENGLTKAHMGTSLLQGVTDQNGLDHARAAFQAWGLDASKLPAIYDKDAIDKAIDSGLSATDYLTKQKNKIDADQKKQEIGIQQQQADTATRNADQTAIRDLNTADYQKSTTQYRNATLGERTRHDKATEAQAAIDNRTTGGLTANAEAVQRRADQKELDKLHQEENELHTLRTQLGSAIASRKAFIDASGKSHPISSDGDEAEAQIEDMRDRYDGATRRLQTVIPQKNDLIQGQGGTVKVSSTDALNNVNAAGKPATGATPAKPQTSTQTPQIVIGTIIKNKAGERRQWTGTSWKVL